MSHHRAKRPERRVRLLLELVIVVPGDIPARRLGPSLISMLLADFYRVPVAFERAELDGQPIDPDDAPAVSPWRRFQPVPDRRVVTLVHELEHVTRELRKTLEVAG